MIDYCSHIHPQLFRKLYIGDSISKGMSLFYNLVLYYLLIIGGVKTSPGPELNSNIRLIHNNVCSVLPKLDIIFNELNEYDIIAITESHLDKSVVDTDIELDRFQPPVRLDRNRHGGGVMLYVKNNLSFNKT